MRHEGRLNLGRAHAVARDIDHIIDPAGDPVIAVGIAFAAVAGEIVAFIIREIGFLEPRMIAPDGTHLAGPAVTNAQHPFNIIAFDLFTAGGFKHDRINTKEGLHRGAGLQGMGAGQGGHHVAAGFGLPPGVNDGNFTAADNLVIPVPGLGVDRLAHGAQQFERGEITFFNVFIALRHQCADGGGGGIELIDLVLFTDLPEAAGIRVGGHAFKDQCGGAIGQRAIDDIAVAGDPAHIGGTPKHIAIMVIEHQLMGHRRINQIAAGGMDHALGGAGGA